MRLPLLLLLLRSPIMELLKQTYRKAPTFASGSLTLTCRSACGWRVRSSAEQKLFVTAKVSNTHRETAMSSSFFSWIPPRSAAILQSIARFFEFAVVGVCANQPPERFVYRNDRRPESRRRSLLCRVLVELIDRPSSLLNNSFKTNQLVHQFFMNYAWIQTLNNWQFHPSVQR